MKARSRDEAWKIVDELMPTDYELDTNDTSYPIYRSTVEGINAWVCDLNARLEVNIPYGKGIKSINVWIEEDEETKNVEEVEEQKPELNKREIEVLHISLMANVLSLEEEIRDMESKLAELKKQGCEGRITKGRIARKRERIQECRNLFTKLCEMEEVIDCK